MGELIRIGAPEGAPGLGATIDTTGAWVTSLSSAQDYVFFPRDLVPTEDGLKLRGGMHLCSPYFGKDPLGVGPQHGSARIQDWQVTDSGIRYVRLRQVIDTGNYDGLSQNLATQVVDIADLQVLATQLSISNQGDRDMFVAPGMHPYFSGPAKFDECHSEAAKDMRSNRTDSYSTRTIDLASGLSVAMVSRNVPNTVAWSDNPAEYHCIEPVALELADDPERSEVLRPGESRSYAVSMRISGGVQSV